MAGKNPHVVYPKIPDDTHGIGLDGFVQGYFSWVLSESPVYHRLPNEPLYCHGTISYRYDDEKGLVVDRPINIRAKIDGEPIDTSETISTETLIVIDVTSCFFFQGDIQENGETIATREGCRLACLEEMQYEDGFFLTIEELGPAKTTVFNIDYLIKHVGPVPLDLEVHPLNPYLDKFAGSGFGARSTQKITTGPKHGYGAVWLAIFKITNPGEYVINSGGNGVPPYHTQALYQFTVLQPTTLIPGGPGKRKVMKLTPPICIPH